ncbi:unnamed protein product [Acanthoscelides obtectus]|uniref:Uncharacterized protein n=1 Tax=Acanthoscelides obtectus TaxID=200917 RepID=A0A9P0JUN3_ACAOB|nr:unnamed protein product [Acanthoscelides obtectus]CAK1621160.1 hypothetical protein AOBTE_LOCUS797 [Acanthoscelides obtectus]
MIGVITDVSLFSVRNTLLKLYISFLYNNVQQSQLLSRIRNLERLMQWILEYLLNVEASCSVVLEILQI